MTALLTNVQPDGDGAGPSPDRGAGKKQGRGGQEQQWEEGEPEYREIVAFHTLEEACAQAFELIGADRGEHALAGGIQIGRLSCATQVHQWINYYQRVASVSGQYWNPPKGLVTKLFF